MEAIVLAGGLGTRLRGIIDDLPKPMAPVAGRPFLALVLDRLVAARFETAVLAVGYRHEAIRRHFGEAYRGLRLRYSVEREPLGTGGAIRLACEQVSARELFVLNGDTFLELDFCAMLAAHTEVGAELSMAIHEVPDASRYGALEVAGGVVRGMREKGYAGPGWINAGVYVMGSGLQARFPDRRAFSFESDVLAPEMASICPRAFRATGLFIDIGVPEDYARADKFLAGQAH
jgi:D-glycero-alpha-D-manno-heptose 1-phosphate guanylyltransferase